MIVPITPPKRKTEQIRISIQWNSVFNKANPLKAAQLGVSCSFMLFWFWKSPVWPRHTRLMEKLALGHGSELAVSFWNHYSSLASRPQPIPAYCKNFLFLSQRGHAFIQLLLIMWLISDNLQARGQTHTCIHTVSKDRCTLFLWERGFKAVWRALRRFMSLRKHKSECFSVKMSKGFCPLWPFWLL